MGVFCATVALIHLKHQAALTTDNHATRDANHLLELIVGGFPEAASLQSSEETGRFVIRNDAGETIGSALTTMPACRDIVGFSGPTNVLIALDAGDRLVQALVLSSGDTQEHVDTILSSAFFEVMIGQEIEELFDGSRVDVVSGATLTSLAIVESIQLVARGSDKRLQPRNSIRFPEPVHIRQVEALLPEAATLERNELGEWVAFDRQGAVVGSILRTVPAADSIVGYQGPTDTLVVADKTGRIIGIVVGESFDNEPYVGYVRDDRYYLKLFNGKTVSNLAESSVEEMRIEGVSGATMTSVAVSEGVFQAAQEQVALELKQAQANQEPAVRSNGMVQLLLVRNLSTLLLVCIAVLVGLSRLKRHRSFRVAFQLLLIVWLGLVNGDLVSQAYLLGLAENGLSTRLLGGMMLLTAASLILPIVTGKNVYCAHICPHGAVQQIVRNRLPWKIRLSGRLQFTLKAFPVLLLIWILAISLLRLPYSAVDVEPFDAWVWYVAGAATIVVAVVGLVASLFVPMAYCRYGCPTGTLLNYLRSSSRSGWSRRDTIGCVLLVAACAMYYG